MSEEHKYFARLTLIMLSRFKKRTRKIHYKVRQMDDDARESDACSLRSATLQLKLKMKG